jgi:hypothetical protein
VGSSVLVDATPVATEVACAVDVVLTNATAPGVDEAQAESNAYVKNSIETSNLLVFISSPGIMISFEKKLPRKFT